MFNNFVNSKSVNKFARKCLTQMSNLQKDQTQELIKETAKKLFFVQGRFNATTQEIADEAGVNRTLINYYFRSRDNLLDIIFEEAKDVDRKKTELIQKSNLPFREKIENFIELSLNTSLRYPYLETYIVSRMNKGNCSTVNREVDESFTKNLFREIEIEMEKGHIQKTEPVQFIFNMVSLLVFPSAARPLFMESLNIKSEEFDKLIAQRKEIIMNLLFNTPQNN